MLKQLSKKFTPSPPPVFFSGEFPGTIANVMNVPKFLDRLPFDYNRLSPTPMDPLRVHIDGNGLYDNSAFAHMGKMQRRAVQKFNTLAEVAD
ncbi:MAG: hypothetical protein WBB94_01725, partial [Candidatus Saccharimonadaceae bacterium]